jgi:hypothetical protein
MNYYSCEELLKKFKECSENKGIECHYNYEHTGTVNELLCNTNDSKLISSMCTASSKDKNKINELMKNKDFETKHIDFSLKKIKIIELGFEIKKK